MHPRLKFHPFSAHHPLDGDSGDIFLLYIIVSNHGLISELSQVFTFIAIHELSLVLFKTGSNLNTLGQNFKLEHCSRLTLVRFWFGYWKKKSSIKYNSKTFYVDPNKF